MAALELPEEALAGLNRAGLRTIGDIAARPAAGIAARFGPEAVVALRRLLGEERAPINPLPQRAPLRFERRFAEPVTHQAAIASHFHALLRQAARALEARGLGGKRFCLTLLRSDGARHRLDIDTSLPTRDPALVLRLFDERIEALADPLDPGFGYDSMTLSLSVTGPLGVIQAALDGEDEDQVALGELIDRLRTRLGPESLRHLVPRDSHIPERSQKTRPAALGSPLPRWPGPLADKPPRPLLLFDPPQPIDVIAQVPDAPPHRFRWRGKLHEICFAEGPERIAPEWWQSPEGHLPGGGVPTRDYYRVENSAGRRFWIFRHGLYAERVNPAWYIHGLFA
jgi:protein ImuB